MGKKAKRLVRRKERLEKSLAPSTQLTVKCKCGMRFQIPAGSSWKACRNCGRSIMGGKV